jgi:hypothetical protein
MLEVKKKWLFRLVWAPCSFLPFVRGGREG